MARKHKHEEEEKLERWLVSYADFITLLFAFFTVLYSISQSDKAKYQAAAESIQRAFLSSGGVFPLKGSPFTPFDKPADKGSQLPPSREDTGKNSKTEQEATDRIREQVQGLFEKSTGLSLKHGDIDVYKTENGFKIRMSESVLYRPGSDKIKRENSAFLYELGRKLSRLGMAIQIEGHTDSREPASGPSNMQISVNRSYHVMKFLVDGANFPKNKISVSGYGDTQPLTGNETEEGRAKNRRVEISVISGQQNMADIPW